MEIFDAMRANLLSPATLFFALGLIAALVKSPKKCAVFLAGCVVACAWRSECRLP